MQDIGLLVPHKSMEAEGKKRWPGEIDEAYPEVYNIHAMPPQPKKLKPGQLPEHMIRKYFEEVNIFFCN